MERMVQIKLVMQDQKIIELHLNNLVYYKIIYYFILISFEILKLNYT